MRNNALIGLSKQDREVMARLLRMPPEEHKAVLKSATPKGEGQRRRRQNERESRGDVKDAL
jgi:hypothetical protein